MKIVLEIDGWIKTIDMPEHIVASEHIRFEFAPPMDVLVAHDGEKPNNYSVRIAGFHRVGYKGGLPLFKYEP